MGGKEQLVHGGAPGASHSASPDCSGDCGVEMAMRELAELGACIPEPAVGDASCVAAPGVLLSLAGGRVATETEVLVEEARPQAVARPDDAVTLPWGAQARGE